MPNRRCASTNDTCEGSNGTDTNSRVAPEPNVRARRRTRVEVEFSCRVVVVFLIHCSSLVDIEFSRRAWKKFRGHPSAPVTYARESLRRMRNSMGVVLDRLGDVYNFRRMATLALARTTLKGGRERLRPNRVARRHLRATGDPNCRFCIGLSVGCQLQCSGSNDRGWA